MIHKPINELHSKRYDKHDGKIFTNATKLKLRLILIRKFMCSYNDMMIDVSYGVALGFPTFFASRTSFLLDNMLRSDLEGVAYSHDKITRQQRGVVGDRSVAGQQGGR